MARNSVKSPNELGIVYLNSSKDTQDLFSKHLNTYRRKHNIYTNLAKQWRETGMYEPITNIRLPVLQAAKAIFGFEMPIISIGEHEKAFETIPLKPQPNPTNN